MLKCDYLGWRTTDEATTHMFCGALAEARVWGMRVLNFGDPGAGNL